MGYNIWVENIGEGVIAVEDKKCVLYDDKLCDDCGECTRCDLDSSKTCDNCMKCIKTGADYNAIEIDEIFESESVPEKY